MKHFRIKDVHGSTHIIGVDHIVSVNTSADLVGTEIHFIGRSIKTRANIERIRIAMSISSEIVNIPLV